MVFLYSNTTLVKVKLGNTMGIALPALNSNTTLVKVKFIKYVGIIIHRDIQIQHLLKLNIKSAM